MIRKYLSEAKAAISSLLIEGSKALEGSGVPDPSLESQAIMAALLGVTRAAVFARLREELGGDERRGFFAWIDRRAKREPLQYITGRAEFFGLTFTVGRDTLIPRPETEALVAEGLSLLREEREAGGAGVPVVADIGTGSGCLAVALAANHPGVFVYAVDSSPGAIDTAAANACTHGVAGRIRFLQGDLFGALDGYGLTGRLDLVASNPPYIPTDEIQALQPEVLYEPVQALDGGPDGLDVIRRIIRDAPKYLKTKGALIMEIGFGQGDAVRGLVDAEPSLDFVKLMPDFAGIERVLVARKSS